MVTNIDELLDRYLGDAHSMEVQALVQMRAAPKIAGDQRFAAIFERHLTETEEHEALIRGRLEERGAPVSKTKDVVMGAAGEAFVLFARSQSDTPGKLASHALSYEHLELATYEVLERVAARAGGEDTAMVAKQIREQEREMSERVEAMFDVTVAASLDLIGSDTDEALRHYLADAHAIEAQSIQLLERGPKIAGNENLAHVYEHHLAESREHQATIERCLEDHGSSPSRLKDAAMRLGALNWGTFFQLQKDTPAKLAAFTYAFEFLEVGGYEQLKRVAERASDLETVAAVSSILEQERAAAETIHGVFDQAVDSSIEAAGAA